MQKYMRWSAILVVLMLALAATLAGGGSAVVLEVELDLASGDLGSLLVGDLDAVLGVEAQVRVSAADDKGGCDSDRLPFGDLDTAEFIGIACFCG